MNGAFQTILDSLPPKSPRSKLEPYSELIHELRKRGRSYREIVGILAERCGIQVGVHTVYNFVRVRTTAGRKRTKAVTPAATTAASVAIQIDSPSAAVRETRPRSRGGMAANPGIERQVRSRTRQRRGKSVPLRRECAVNRHLTEKCGVRCPELPSPNPYIVGGLFGSEQDRRSG